MLDAPGNKNYICNLCACDPDAQGEQSGIALGFRTDFPAKIDSTSTRLEKAEGAPKRSGPPEESVTSKTPSPRRSLEPLCSNAADLYTASAREQIGEVLDSWLANNLATPFELLHRPDLIKKLEASSRDLQHAFQKVAVPMALARRASVHEVMRSLHGVADQAIARMLRDERQGLLPRIDGATFAAACATSLPDPEHGYRLAAGVAGFIAAADSWGGKVSLLMDLAEAAPADGSARTLALTILEQALEDVCRSPLGMAELLGPDLDLGALLLGMTRLAHGGIIDAVFQAHASLRPLASPLPAAGARLARRIDRGDFPNLQLALSRRILTELDSKRRLAPDSAMGEITAVRGLAVALTAASGPCLPAEDVAEAILIRSQRLVEPNFIATLLHQQVSLVAGLDGLLTVLKNVTGDANRRRALRFIEATVTPPQFKTDLLDATGSPEAALEAVAGVYRKLTHKGSGLVGIEPLLERLSEVGGALESEGAVVRGLTDGLMPRARKLAALQAMAEGKSAPPGPAAKRAADALRKFAATQDPVSG